MLKGFPENPFEMFRKSRESLIKCNEVDKDLFPFKTLKAVMAEATGLIGSDSPSKLI